MENETIKRGDIVFINFGEAKDDERTSIQKGVRPAIIIQNNLGNKFSGTTIVIPLTSRMSKHNIPTHVLIEKSNYNGLKCNSIALCEQIMTVDKKRLQQKIGILSELDIKRVTKGLKNSITNVLLEEDNKNEWEINRQKTISNVRLLDRFVTLWLSKGGKLLDISKEISELKMHVQELKSVYNTDYGELNYVKLLKENNIMVM